MSKINKEKQATMPQKVVKELFGYDSKLNVLVWAKKHHPKANSIKIGQPAGYVDNKTGYVVIMINGYHYYVHRLIWTYFYGDYPEGEQPLIDHINGKKADNRIENLRVSSSGENSRNRKKASDNTSGITGVRRAEKVIPSGKIYVYWEAYWYNENGKQRVKRFPIHKLGEYEAKQMAINYRAEQLRLLELNHGIVYSDRHGI